MAGVGQTSQGCVSGAEKPVVETLLATSFLTIIRGAAGGDVAELRLYNWRLLEPAQLLRRRMPRGIRFHDRALADLIPS